MISPCSRYNNIEEQQNQSHTRQSSQNLGQSTRTQYNPNQNNRIKYFFNLRKIDNRNKWKNYVIVIVDPLLLRIKR